MFLLSYAKKLILRTHITSKSCYFGSSAGFLSGKTRGCQFTWCVFSQAILQIRFNQPLNQVWYYVFFNVYVDIFQCVWWILVWPLKFVLNVDIFICLSDCAINLYIWIWFVSSWIFTCFMTICLIAKMVFIFQIDSRCE